MKSFSEMVLVSYGLLFARGWATWLNKALISLGARGLGFNWCCDHKRSGEAWLAALAWRTGARHWLDGGANIGTYSSLISSLGGTTVAAFEPMPGSADALEDLVRHRGLPVSVLRYALSGSDGELTLWSDGNASEHAQASVLHRTGEASEDRGRLYEVEARTLDSLYADENTRTLLLGTDFVKLDTEGWELEILKGARNFLAEVRPNFIQIEFNKHNLTNGASLPRFAEVLPGYQLFQLLPRERGIVWRDPFSAYSSLGFYSNFVFVASDMVSRLATYPGVRGLRTIV